MSSKTVVSAILSLVILGFLYTVAQPSTLASVDDAIVDSKPAKRITLPSLIGEVDVSAMASTLKVKPSELMNITVKNYRGSIRVSLKTKVNITRQRAIMTSDCNCINVTEVVFANATKSQNTSGPFSYLPLDRSDPSLSL